MPASGSWRYFSASSLYTQPIFFSMTVPNDALTSVSAMGFIISTNAFARSFLPIADPRGGCQSTYTSNMDANLIARRVSRRLCSKSCSSRVKSVPAMASVASFNRPMKFSICSDPNNTPKNAAGFTTGTSSMPSLPRASYCARSFSSERI